MGKQSEMKEMEITDRNYHLESEATTQKNKSKK
jgi:hypothetical protein